MKLRKSFLCLVVGGLAAVIFATLAPEVQAANPFNKVGRGLGNIVIAPVEIPVSMVSEAKKNPLLGLVIGPIIGAVNCVTRATAGIVELVTFPVPPYDQPLYEKDLGETVWE
ncbi:MAG: exosortase system-associated protein, TIGR04073 family [Nitrospirae bacterium]|nr:exosortase system-associated protein, TIGR04073 family [Nitrospirota bacterium]